MPLAGEADFVLFLIFNLATLLPGPLGLFFEFLMLLIFVFLSSSFSLTFVLQPKRLGLLRGIRIAIGYIRIILFLSTKGMFQWHI